LPDNRDDLALITQEAKAAGDIALRYFKRDPEVWLKTGDSPVSEADFAVDKHLGATLQQARPDYGWLSEETTDDVNARQGRSRVFVVDPIDGTRGFLAGSRRWCVSIAIVEDGLPVAGVLHCPALDETYTANLNDGAALNGEKLSAVPEQEPWKVAGPGALITALRNWRDGGGEGVEKLHHVPSLAYRIAMVASGAATLGFAKHGAKDWDIAAADLILAEAGGALLDAKGERLRYNSAAALHPTLIAGPLSLKKEMLVFAARHME
jgi:myo-inositol-1(or 4)-monophosphatase